MLNIYEPKMNKKWTLLFGSYQYYIEAGYSKGLITMHPFRFLKKVLFITEFYIHFQS